MRIFKMELVSERKIVKGEAGDVSGGVRQCERYAVVGRVALRCMVVDYAFFIGWTHLLENKKFSDRPNVKIVLFLRSTQKLLHIYLQGFSTPLYSGGWSG